MAAYSSGRRNGVNVSQYIANLNKEPSAFEVARSEEQEYLVDDESLAQFTNTDFFDFETPDFLSEAHGGAAGGGLAYDDNAKAEKQGPTRKKTGNGLEFVNGAFPTQAVSSFEVNTALPQQPQRPQPLFTDYTSQPALPLSNYQTTSPTSATTAYPPFPTGPQSALNSAAAAASPTDSSSDPARALAEEDKRRRNTAASARFRVKKKQREQALEQKTQELEKAKQVLEQRVGQLETENEWLRGLVVEKNGGPSRTAITKNQKVPETETDSGKKGVGTED